MGLKGDLETVLVKDTNLRPPVMIADDATVRMAVEAMRSAGLGCVVVVDSEAKAVGMFTEGILRHCLNESASVLEEKVTSHMVSRLPWVSPSEPVGVVLDAMEKHNIRFLAVLDDERHVVGITGQKTFMEFLAEYFPSEVIAQDPTAVTFSRSKEGA